MKIISILYCLMQITLWSQWQSAVVYPGVNGTLEYAVDSEGNRIPDFSYAGYKNGNYPIPVIAVVDSVSPVAGDNTVNIQNAINRVALRSLDGGGFRGALLIKAGIYRVASPLYLNASGVVIRGAGEGIDSLTNTIIVATGDSIGQPTVLIAGGGNGGSNGSAWSGKIGSNVNITSDSVHVGERTFNVVDASSFSVGDNVIIYHPDTTPWKRAVQWGGVPNDTGTTSYWAGVSIPIKYNRFITAINGNSITIDAPVFTTLVRSLSQSYMYKTDRGGILTNIGIENIRIDINNPFNQSPGSHGDEAHHAQDAVWLGKIEDAWVRHCTALHFVQSGFKTSIATRVTFDSCSALDPISIIDGSRRYNFNTYTASQLILFSNCYASYARHAYVSNGTSTVSGIVFYHCISEKSFNASEGHRLWSQGLLYDNFKDINTNVTSGNHVLGLYNRGDMGSGHGWAAVHSVAWNCTTGTSNIVIQKPPTAQNYAIGCTGGVTGAKPPAPFNQPQGYIEGTNVAGILPSSLFIAQRNDRSNIPVPVELSSSSAVANGFTVRIHWTTATETNNFGFEIQRKTTPSNSNWISVGFIKGHGTSNIPHEYTFEDKNLVSGRYAYRLKQIDRSGEFKYSSEMEVLAGTMVQEGKFFEAFPNPCNPSTNIRYEIPVSTFVQLTVFDYIGRRVEVLVDKEQTAGYYQVEWNAARFPSGMYFCRLQTNALTRTKKIVIIK